MTSRCRADQAQRSVTDGATFRIVPGPRWSTSRRIRVSVCPRVTPNEPLAVHIQIGHCGALTPQWALPARSVPALFSKCASGRERVCPIPLRPATMGCPLCRHEIAQAPKTRRRRRRAPQAFSVPLAGHACLTASEERLVQPGLGRLRAKTACHEIPRAGSSLSARICAKAADRHTAPCCGATPIREKVSGATSQRASEDVTENVGRQFAADPSRPGCRRRDICAPWPSAPPAGLSGNGLSLGRRLLSKGR